MKTIVCCAITGSGTRPEQTPYLPITPEQIATSALEAAEAGASVVHIHVRNPETGRPSMELDLYRDTVDRIKKYNTDVLINLTTGLGAHYMPDVNNPAQAGPGTNLVNSWDRIKHIVTIKPDLCSLDFNTMHQAQGVRINHIPRLKHMLKNIQDAGTKPELEIFDSGDLRIAKEFIAEGLVKGEPLWQFAMGVKYGWESTPETLDYARKLLPAGATWSAFGIGKTEMPMVALTYIYGGHIRVGLEDNIYLERGVLAKTNAELVKRSVDIIKLLGGNIANPKETREIYKI